MAVKNLFLTKTVIMGFFGMVTAVSPILNSVISDGRWLTFTELQGIAAAIVSFIGVCIGRHEATATAFTPKGLPGRNKEDADSLAGNLLDSALDTAIAKLVPIVLEQLTTDQNAQQSIPISAPASANPSANTLVDTTSQTQRANGTAAPLAGQRILYCLRDSWLLEEPGSAIDLSYQGKRIQAAKGSTSYGICNTIATEGDWIRFTTQPDGLQWFALAKDFQLM